jgi:hypothetical protein
VPSASVSASAKISVISRSVISSPRAVMAAWNSAPVIRPSPLPSNSAKVLVSSASVAMSASWIGWGVRIVHTIR